MEKMSDLELKVQAKRNRAIRSSVKRQLKEDKQVDPEVVCEDLWESEGFVQAMQELTKRQVQLIETPVLMEVDEERREAAIENKHRRQVKTGLNNGTGNELKKLGAHVQ